jgi:hypothetical protein
MVDAPLKIDCYDWDSDGSSDFIGSCETTARQLIELTTRNWALVNHEKKKNGGISGTLKLLSAKLAIEHSFLDYLAGGCEVSMMVAVDFTGSNGDPRDTRSLHYVNPNAPNEYERALEAVGSVVAPYDSDGRFQMVGFGAKINGQPNHCFGMTPPEGVEGVAGMLQTYRSVVQQIELWGPTNFTPTISSAAQLASQFQTQQDQKYFILLILTDGVITDMDQTKAGEFIPKVKNKKELRNFILSVYLFIF